MSISEDKEESEAIIVNDVMDIADCQFWTDMTHTELEEWYNPDITNHFMGLNMSHKTEIVVMLFFSDTNYVSLITKTVLGEVVKKCFQGYNIKVREVNYDSEIEVCGQYGVSGVPVTLVFWNDELIGRHHGEITFKEFKALLQDYCVPQE